MDEIGAAVSSLKSSGSMGQVNVAMLKKTQDMAASQVNAILDSIPKPKSMNTGQNFDAYA